VILSTIAVLCYAGLSTPCFIKTINERLLFAPCIFDSGLLHDSAFGAVKVCQTFEISITDLRVAVSYEIVT
jgi:hypothetical protein